MNVCVDVAPGPQHRAHDDPTPQPIPPSQPAAAAQPTHQAVTSRRTLLGASVGALALGAVPALASASPLHQSRPVLGDGVQSGDVTFSSATVWTRSDRTARMIVEASTRPDFAGARRFVGPVLSPSSDFTGKTELVGLPAGRDVHYRVWAQDLDRRRVVSEPLVGRLRTPSRSPRDVDLVWSGDLAGQGYGINPDLGGYRIFSAIADIDPDVYLCNGDNIYADVPIPASQTAPDGSVWRSLTSDAKSKVAETLQEYRGNYRYNLMDDNLRRLYAQTAQIQQWDDHETRNNWYPGETIDDPRYTVTDVDVLARRARRAFHEYTPLAPQRDADGRIYRVLHLGPLVDVFVLDMRWYRDPNSPNRQTRNDGGLLGRRQQRWLERELLASRATWKIISNDMPLTEVVPDATQGQPNFEAVAQGDNGAPLGRELQIAELLHFLQRHRIHNTVWLTTDVHYTAAHYFDPDKAAFDRFDPFWQFTTGPLNAGSFPAAAVDTTFGAQQVFVKAPSTPNSSPAEWSFFGSVHVDAWSRALRVDLRDHAGQSLWHTTLEPR